jgi:hypothetical protein
MRAGTFWAKRSSTSASADGRSASRRNGAHSSILGASPPHTALARGMCATRLARLLRSAPYAPLAAQRAPEAGLIRCARPSRLGPRRGRRSPPARWSLAVRLAARLGGSQLSGGRTIWCACARYLLPLPPSRRRFPPVGGPAVKPIRPPSPPRFPVGCPSAPREVAPGARRRRLSAL